MRSETIMMPFGCRPRPQRQSAHVTLDFSDSESLAGADFGYFSDSESFGCADSKDFQQRVYRDFADS